MALSPRTRTVALALCGWTLFTWGLRVPLLLGDDALSVGSKVVSLLPVLVFVVCALVAARAVWRRLDESGAALVALAGWTILYWPVRIAFVLANDHPVAFYVVHTVLAVIAVGLAVAALRGVFADGAAPNRSRRRTLA